MDVAIKKLHAHTDEKEREQAKSLLQNEFKTLSLCRHQNVVQILNICFEPLLLCGNNITDDSGIQSIIDVLKTNNTLKHLYLFNNQLSDNMISQLKAIQQYKRDGSNGYQQVEWMWIAA